MRKIPFVKMQAAGNDFIVIDHQDDIDYPDLARHVCHRNLGVGADGLLVLDKSSTCDYRMRIINSDGSEAEMCGNGARCMALYIARQYALVPEVFSLETAAGTINASADHSMARIQLSDPRDFRSGQELRIGPRKLLAHSINTGVPHAVIFVTGLAELAVESLGPAIRNHPLFAPKGTNVNFVEHVREGVIAIRTYERGVEGETLACGTGSAAAALIACLQASTKPAAGPVQTRVMTRSGEVLEVSFDLLLKDNKPVPVNVWLKGPAHLICQGQYLY